VEKDARPLLMVDDQRRILWSSAAADRLLKRPCGLMKRDGYLVAEDWIRIGNIDAWLHDTSDANTSLCFRAPRPDRHVLLRAWRLGTLEEKAVFGLHILPGGRDFQPEYSGIDVAYGLTPAEQRVVSGMLNGATAEQIAAVNGASIETVRTHIRNVYNKLDVKSREALFHKLGWFRVA
jgi:DNA-binding CsgD family transcriptional regulator